MEQRISKEIVEKIRKIYTLSMNNPSEEEAALASEKVKELLTRYQIDMKDVLIEKNEVEDVTFRAFNKTIPGWISMLSAIVAVHHSCFAYITNSNLERKIQFVGLPSDIEVAEYTFEYLKNVVTTLTRGVKTPLRTNGRSFKNSYRLGVITGIESRLKELREKRNRTMPEEKALVVVKDAKVKKYRAALRLRKGGPRRVSSNDGFDSGFHDGRHVEVFRGIKSSGIKKLN